MSVSICDTIFPQPSICLEFWCWRPIPMFPSNVATLCFLYCLTDRYMTIFLPKVQLLNPCHWSWEWKTEVWGGRFHFFSNPDVGITRSLNCKVSSIELNRGYFTHSDNCIGKYSPWSPGKRFQKHKTNAEKRPRGMINKRKHGKMIKERDKHLRWWSQTFEMAFGVISDDSCQCGIQ